MSPFYNFRKDKIIGDEAEEKVLKILHKKGLTQAYRVTGKEVRWDIVIPETGKKIEIKNDVMSARTGNLAIEMYKSNGELSGIMATQSDLWVIFSMDDMYVVDTNALKEYVIKNENNHRITQGGDRNATTMLLLPIDTMKKQSFFKELF